MNSYVGMTKQDYFIQQSTLFPLTAYISATDYQSTCVGW